MLSSITLLFLWKSRRSHARYCSLQVFEKVILPDNQSLKRIVFLLYCESGFMGGGGSGGLGQQSTWLRSHVTIALSNSCSA